MTTVNLGRVQGESAYQAYVRITTDNPKKTEAQWIASLKGDKGDRGEAGSGGGTGGHTQKQPSFLQLKPHPYAKNPVLTKDDITDVTADFVADPFIVQENGMYYMFFEVLDSTDKKGKIGYATSSDGVNWTYQKIIFYPDSHVSFPHVFRHEGEWYMTVENFVVGNGLRLYKFNNFPEEPVLHATLATSHIHVDAALFKYRDYWYIFSNSQGGQNLFFSQSLTGPYTFHSVLWTGAAQTRPAGKAIVYDDCVDVPIQSNTPRGYGSKVNMYRLRDVSPNPSIPIKYHVFENPLVEGSDIPGTWNSFRMHAADFLLNDDFSLPNNELTIVAVDGESSADMYSIGIYTIDTDPKPRYLRYYNGGTGTGLSVISGKNDVKCPTNAHSTTVSKNSSFDNATGVLTVLESGVYSIDFSGHLFLDSNTAPFDVEVLLQVRKVGATTFTDASTCFVRPISGSRIGLEFSDCLYLNEGEAVKLVIQNGSGTTTLKFYKLAYCKILDSMA